MTLPIVPVRASLFPDAPHSFPDIDETASGLSESSSSTEHIIANGRKIRVSNGVARAADLSAAGIRVYDPGYAHTLSCRSSITSIDGFAGVLRHRGYPIESLVSKCTFLELAYLLLFGELPSRRQCTHFANTLAHPSYSLTQEPRRVVASFSPNSHPMGILIAALSALGTSHASLNPSVVGNSVYNKRPVRGRVIACAMSGVPALAAAIHRHCNGESPIFVKLPDNSTKWTFARRFLYMVDPSNKLWERDDSPFVRALEMLFMLHADHEQNCSTSTMRNLSSSGVDTFSALAGATAALYGPLHGGASEAVLHMLARIGEPSNIGKFLESVKRREERLMGFGHRVYKNYDPRARLVRGVAHEVFDSAGKTEPLIEVATALEKAALNDEYFVKRKLFPNVDFYSGVIYKAMGFKPQFLPVLFVIGRTAGWLAQWLEFLDDPDRRIARPHQVYTGHVGPRRIVNIEERNDAPNAPKFSWIPAARL